MTDRFSTVFEVWGMCCPNCQADDRIDVTAMIAVRLTPDGSDAESAEDARHHWDDNHPAVCRACGHTAIVAAFAA